MKFIKPDDITSNFENSSVIYCWGSDSDKVSEFEFKKTLLDTNVISNNGMNALIFLIII